LPSRTKATLISRVDSEPGHKPTKPGETKIYVLILAQISACGIRDCPLVTASGTRRAQASEPRASVSRPPSSMATTSNSQSSLSRRAASESTPDMFNQLPSRRANATTSHTTTHNRPSVGPDAHDGNDSAFRFGGLPSDEEEEVPDNTTATLVNKKCVRYHLNFQITNVTVSTVHSPLLGWMKYTLAPGSAGELSVIQAQDVFGPKIPIFRPAPPNVLSMKSSHSHLR
jgi:hypothetical protein